VVGLSISSVKKIFAPICDVAFDKLRQRSSPVAEVGFAEINKLSKPKKRLNQDFRDLSEAFLILRGVGDKPSVEINFDANFQIHPRP
jgi:hypothetical protein